MTTREDLFRAIDDEGGVVPCQNAPDFFFETEKESPRTFKIARELCGACPIQNVCLSYALDNGEEFGVWGGLSARERRLLIRRAA